MRSLLAKCKRGNLSLFLLSLGCFSSFNVALAEAPRAAEIRASLRSADSRDSRKDKLEYSEPDFSWEHLSGGGLAAGKDPIIGKGSGKKYVDLSDEQVPPYVKPAGAKVASARSAAKPAK